MHSSLSRLVLTCAFALACTPTGGAADAGAPAPDAAEGAPDAGAMTDAGETADAGETVDAGEREEVEPDAGVGARPVVLSVTPTAGETAVPGDTVIELNFSREMDPASFRASNCALSRHSVLIPSTLTVSGHVARFVPTNPLPRGGYIGVVVSQVRATDGAELDGSYVFAFTVDDGSWSTPTTASAPGPVPSESIDFALAAAPGERALLAFTRLHDVSGSNQRSAFVSWYAPATGWGPATLLESDAAPATAIAPEVGEAGHASVVFRQDRMRAVSMPPSGTWSAAVDIDAAPGASSWGPALSVDGDGNAVAVWSEQVNPSSGVYRTDVWANRREAGGAWGTPLTLEAAPGDAHVHGVAGDAAGRVFVGWQEFAADGTHAMVRRYVPGSGWASAERVSDGTRWAESPSLGTDGEGNALATWYQWEEHVGGGNPRIVRNAYKAELGWQGRVMTDDATDQWAGSPRAIASLNTDILAWTEYDAASESHLWSARREPSGNWTLPSQVESRPGGVGDAVVFEGNRYGDAILAWAHDGASSTTIVAKRYVFGAGWHSEHEVATVADSVEQLAGSIDDSGAVTLVWREQEESGPVLRAARFE